MEDPAIYSATGAGGTGGSPPDKKHGHAANYRRAVVRDRDNLEVFFREQGLLK